MYNYEVITKHSFTGGHGCYGSTSCDWGCSCDLHEECKHCHTKRAEKTTEKDDEVCPGRSEGAQKEYELRFRLSNPLTKAVKGTDLKIEQMALEENYLASDFTSVPDCSWSCMKKLEGSTLFKLTTCGGGAYHNLKVACNTCIGGLDITYVDHPENTYGSMHCTKS